jgi:hypothetical protein
VLLTFRSNLLSFCLLSRNLNTELTFLSAVLYNPETWSLTLSGFEVKVLRKIFELERKKERAREEVTCVCRNYVIRSFTIYAPHYGICRVFHLKLNPNYYT